MGTKLEIYGLPVAMGKEGLQDFLGAWQVHPLHAFRHGFRRTWIVRASTEPTDKLIAHDFELAVIKEAAAARAIDDGTFPGSESRSHRAISARNGNKLSKVLGGHRFCLFTNRFEPSSQILISPNPIDLLKWGTVLSPRNQT